MYVGGILGGCMRHWGNVPWMVCVGTPAEPRALVNKQQGAESPFFLLRL